MVFTQAPIHSPSTNRGVAKAQIAVKFRQDLLWSVSSISRNIHILLDFCGIGSIHVAASGIPWNDAKPGRSRAQGGAGAGVANAQRGSTTMLKPTRQQAKNKSGSRSSAAPAHTKTNSLLKFLSRLNGATINELVKATGWQPHSVRAFLADHACEKAATVLVIPKTRLGPLFQSNNGET